jgi:uncharacterized membrane-anchored protein
MNKIPKLGLLYWIMKITATTLGETGGNLVSMTMNLGLAIYEIVTLPKQKAQVAV